MLMSSSGGLMVFAEIIRYSPRRRASPWIAESFSPTARAVERIIAVLTKIEPDGQGWILLGMARPTRWPK